MSPVLIRDLTPADGQAFKALNLAWIEPLLGVSESDLAQLDDPWTSIVEPGGRAFVAEMGGDIVGTIALLKGRAAGTYEIVKMSARADRRGLGIGKALLQAAISAADALGAQTLWLETNGTLDAAIGLYRSHGFRELSCDERRASDFGRCDIQMVLQL